jgi:hypothetical protein
MVFVKGHSKEIMAYAAYRESFGANNPPALQAVHVLDRQLVVLDLTVPSGEAFRVRRLLAGCADTGVVRCIPRPHDSLVLLEIQLPADRVQEVLHLVMTLIPSGEVGALTSWKHHLTTHGLTHGF